jgi:hypothetical protein
MILQEKVRLAKLSQAREERQRIIYLDTEKEAAKIPRYLQDNETHVGRSRSASPTKRSPSKVKKVAWDNSTKGAELPLRSSLEVEPDAVVSSPAKAQKSWVESLRSPDLPRRATSTPILDKQSCDDLSVIGSRNRMANRTKAAKRSKSVPRSRSKYEDEIEKLKSKSETRLSSSAELNRSYDKLQDAHRQLTANVTQLEAELKVFNRNCNLDSLLICCDHDNYVIPTSLNELQMFRHLLMNDFFVISDQNFGSKNLKS